jgi:MFS family permease
MTLVITSTGLLVRSSAATRGDAWLTAVLVFLAAVSSAVASLGAPLLPTIVAVDHVSLSDSQWALTISLLVGAIATPLLGRLGDGRHRRATTLATVAAVSMGCLLSALPFGFGVLLMGRALQGVGLALAPLATAVARENLPKERSRRAIVAVGITTAAGVGAGYPLAGLFAQEFSLNAAFAAGAVLSLVGLVAAAAVLPASPHRTRPIDLTGAVILAAGIASLLLAIAQGPSWGWASSKTVAAATVAVGALAGWVIWELHTPGPLVQLRLLARRSVLVGNLSCLLVALGFYPLVSLVVRYVQTPPATGYGFGASALVAGVMLTPFSVGTLAARRPAMALAKATSAEWVIAAASLILGAGQTLFLVDRFGYPGVVASMALTGVGVGAVFAVNPIQIVDGVPADETGSAISFYQVVKTVGYSVASALSATVLVAYLHQGRHFPANAGYSAASLVDLGVLACTLVVGVVLGLRPARRAAPAKPLRLRGTPSVPQSPSPYG